MLRGLAAAGVPAELIQPEPFLGRIAVAGPFVAKWLGYLDKFLFFPRQLRRKLAADFDLVHICDHSNAMYCAARRRASRDRHLSRFARRSRRARRRDRLPGFCDRQISAALDRLGPAPGQRGGLRLIRHSARRGAHGQATRRPAATSAHSITASIIPTENSPSIARTPCFRASKASIPIDLSRSTSAPICG